jgi:hypothetical protein
MATTASSTRIDILLLYVARGVRGLGDGFAIIILPAYAHRLRYGEIGIVVSASLPGTALLTLAVGSIAPRHDLCNLLPAVRFHGLHAATFHRISAQSSAIVAFVGTINPSTGDLGVLVPLEHAMLAQGVPDHERTRTFARYSLIGALSMAVGSLAAALPDFMAVANIDKISGFKIMFYGYAVLGLVCALLYRRLPHAQMDETRPSAPLGPSRRLSQTGRFVSLMRSQAALLFSRCWRYGYSLLTCRLGCKRSGGTPSAFSSSRGVAFKGLASSPMVFTHIPSSILIAAAFSPNLILALGCFGESRNFANGRSYADVLRHGRATLPSARPLPASRLFLAALRRHLARLSLVPCWLCRSRDFRWCCAGS